MQRVGRRWKPDAVPDLHEYAQTPVFYDEEVQDPPPCSYRITRKQAEELRTTFAIHGIETNSRKNAVIVPMGQPVEG